MTDRSFMRRAFELAARGTGTVSPNPAVGAVLVRDGTIIGEGFHAYYGGPHAESECIRDAARRGHDARGATMYCTLEPCSFRSPCKHNPPCTETLIEAGIARLVIAARDPNPAVAGNGVEILRDAGIQVACGLMEQQAIDRDEGYFLSAVSGRPFVHLKWAQSLNGRIAKAGGGPTTISGAGARAHAHGIRAAVDAILVGRTTVEADDPQLTVRYRQPQNTARTPLLVVIDPQLLSCPEAQVFASPDRAMIFVDSAAAAGKRSKFKERGVTVIALRPESDGRFAVRQVLDALYARGVRSVLVEGGAETHRLFLASGVWDRLTVYLGSVLLDGDLVPARAECPSSYSEGLAHRVFVPLDDTVCVTGLNPNSARRRRQLFWRETELTGGGPARSVSEKEKEPRYVHRFGA